MIKRLLFLLIILCGLAYAERVWAGHSAVGTAWYTTPASQVIPNRPICGMRGFVLLSLPGNIAQYDSSVGRSFGPVYHTHSNGSLRGSEFLIYYNKSNASAFGDIVMKLFRWCPATITTNRLTNGDFGTSTGWTTTSGWSISGGVATHSGAGVTTLSRPDCGGVINQKERVMFTLSNWTSGSVTINIGGKPSNVFGSPNGTKTATIRSINTNALTFTPSGSFAGDIDNITVTPYYEYKFRNLLDTSDRESTGSSTDSGEKNTTDDIEATGWAKYGITISNNGSVTSAANPYVTDIAVGTETKKAIYFEDVSVFTPLYAGTTTGRWLEIIRLRNFNGTNSGNMDMKWAHQWEGKLEDNFPISPHHSHWAGHLEVFNYGSYSPNPFNSQGTVSVGNHQMDMAGPIGNFVPFNTNFLYLTSTDVGSNPTGITVYNPSASPGSWLAHVP